MRLFTWLSRHRFPYEPLITVSISRERLLHNLREFAGHANGALIAPVLKSNAYGHGLIEVAGILREAGHIPFFVVDSYFEAIALRAKGIRTPLLIIGYTRPETIASSHLPEMAFTIASLDALKALLPTCRDVHTHIKIDTGMHRQGILPEEIPTAIDILQNNPRIKLDGLATHLCDADNPDESFTQDQLRVWDKSVKTFKAVFPAIKYVHAAATDGSRYADSTTANVTRLGIGLYGLSDNAALNAKLDLKPVLAMKTIVTGVKKLEAGKTIGYGKTFKVEKKMLVATIPVGYYEGIDRRLSSIGAIQVGPKNEFCPIVGRISMNITTIDVTAVVGVKVGMEVSIISCEPDDANSIRSMARRCDTIPYEIAVHIPAALKRVVD